MAGDEDAPARRPSAPGPDHEVRALVDRTFRQESGRALATLTRLLGDLDAAEEAVADAFLAAVETWPRDGVPTNPGAWITTVARNRALDRVRRARRHADKLIAIERELVDSQEEPVRLGSESRLADDRLRLIFTCCHPALPLEARVALTLRTLGGLTTPEIARAFLVPEATLAQRIVRAKAKIRTAGIPYRVPPDDLLPERLDGVLAVLYLVFNEGYSASTGADLIRRDLCSEAIRLARLLHELLPEHTEANGLLALLLLQDSRRDARVGPRGELILLEDQDRSRWDQAEIDEGLDLVDTAFGRVSAGGGTPGPYLLQAAISAVHARSANADATAWSVIAGLYEALVVVAPSPVVELNRAVAIAMTAGAGAGLAMIEPLEREGALSDYHLFHAARADMLRRLGRRPEAAAAYRRALALATNAPERDFLARRLADLRSDA